MTDKERKSKIADILLEFYEEYQCNMPNRPMIPSIYAGKILDSLPAEPVSPCVECASISEGCKEICFDYNKWVRDNHKEEPVSEDLEEAIKRAADETKLTKAKNGHPFFSEEDFNLGFSNGAQWQKKRYTKNLRAEIQRRYEYHLGCMQGSRDDTYPEISHAHHRVIKDELFEILCFLDVLENETE